MKELQELSAAIDKMRKDAADAASDKQSAMSATLDEVAAALTDIVQVLENRKDSIPLLVAAIHGIKMDAAQVTVEVNPTPVTVQNHVAVSPTPVEVFNNIQAAPAPSIHIEGGSKVGSKWLISLPSQGGVERTATVTRVN